ncbi:PAS domain S-box protein [Humidesulfovibrio sp.]
MSTAPTALSGDRQPVSGATPRPAAHRRARRLAQLGAVGGVAFGALGLADALTGQHLFGGRFWPQYIPMAVSTALLFLLFGGALLFHAGERPERQPERQRGERPGVRAAWLAVLGLGTVLGAAQGLAYLLGMPAVLPMAPYDRLLSLFFAAPTPMSPLTSALFALAGCALWLLHSRSASAAATLRNDVAGYLGVLIVFIGLTLLGGYLHGAPFLYGTGVVPVAATTTVAFLCLGVGIVCAAGPGSLFLRAFFGDSVKARLMRIFPPMVAGMFLFHPGVELLVARVFEGDADLLFSLQVTVLAALTAAGTSLTVRIIGVSIDRETEMRQRAEALAISQSQANRAHAEIAEALITPGMTLQGLSDIVHRVARELTGSQYAFVSTIDPATGDNVVHTLSSMFAHGECRMDRDIVFKRGPDGQYPALWGHALNTLEAFFDNDPAAHPAAQGLPAGHVRLEQFLTVPVCYERVLVGQIGLANPGRAFGQEDLDLVRSLADLFALGVYRLRSEQQLLEAKLDLERTVHLRTQDLEEANAELKREVAEREMFQEALKESAALFRAVVEDQTELICRFKPDGTILFVNNAYARYFGKHTDELTGKGFFAFLTPQGQEQVRELVAGLSRVTPVKTHEHTVLTPAGQVAWHAWTNRGIFDELGRLQAIQAVGRDITQAKESENALRELNERLEEKVRERTIQLEERTLSVLQINADLQEQIATRQRAEEGLSRAAKELEAKVRQITCLYEISEHLVNTGAEQFPEALALALGELGRFLGFDQVLAYVHNEDAGELSLSHQWRGVGRDAGRDAGQVGADRGLEGFLPLLRERLLANERVVIPDAALLPEGDPARALLAGAGVRSLVAAPMTIRGRLNGALLLAGAELAAGAELGLLDNVALLLANALDKQRVDCSLRESERLARSIIESLAANICVIDHAGELIMVNRAWESFALENAPMDAENLGLGANYVQVCRKAAQDGEPLAAQAAEGISAVLAGSLPVFNLEYSCHSPTEQRWFIMQVVPFFGGGSGAVIAHRDITARTLAAAEVHRSEERYRIIVETAQEGVLGLDADAVITYTNPRMLAMLGYSFGELVGLRLADVIVPEDMPLIQSKQQERRQGRSDLYELRYLAKDGSHIWTMTSVAPVMGPDGVYAGTIGMSMDISDRVRAEQRIRKSEARYRSLVEAMQEGLLRIKPDGRIGYMNASFAEMLGRPQKEILGRQVESFVSAKSRDVLAAQLSPQRSGSGAVEVVWEHSSGKHIYSLFSLAISRDEQGGVIGYYAIVTDTTARKALESQLLQSQKLEAIGQLAAGIAHEINTPAQYVGSNVRFIKGAFESILHMCGKTRQFMQAAMTTPPTCADVEELAAIMAEHDIDFLEAEVPGAIAQTLEGVERISTIVHSVKQFAHPGESTMSLADLNEAMRSTVTVSRNEWKYVADLTTDLDETLPLVTCMIGEINQVVLNLIVNAAHAIAEVRKKGPEEKGSITLTTRYAPPWAEIRVADSGAGIPPEVQAKIFDPFFTTKEVGKGTGQGLTISRGIVVDKHGGQMFFETEPGKGTTFVVRLPLVQSEERMA